MPQPTRDEHLYDSTSPAQGFRYSGRKKLEFVSAMFDRITPTYDMYAPARPPRVSRPVDQTIHLRLQTVDPRRPRRHSPGRRRFTSRPRSG